MKLHRFASGLVIHVNSNDSAGGRACTNPHLEFKYCSWNSLNRKTDMAWRIRSFWRLPWWRWWGAKIDDFINGNSDQRGWLEIVRHLRQRRWQVGGWVKWQLNEERKNTFNIWQVEIDWLKQCVASCDWIKHSLYNIDIFLTIMSRLITLTHFLFFVSV